MPSAALVARADAKGALNTLVLGLGAVALLVGAVGVANIMVISALERRSEIGLRRALGATKSRHPRPVPYRIDPPRPHRRRAGVLADAAATAIYAHTRGWPIVIPAQAWAGGSAPPCSSAPSPGFCPRSAPPARPRPKRYP